MTHILYVRHGRTEWNATGRTMGQQDIPLDELGRRQAQAVARALAGVALDVLITSDLRRARDTAEAINAHHGLDPRREPRLRERAFGLLEGLTPEEIRRKHPQHAAAYERDTLRYRAPGAESRLEFLLRVGPYFEGLVRERAGQTLAVVAHGGVLRALLSHLVSREMGLDEPRFVGAFAVDNCSLSHLVHRDGRWTVKLLNQTSHLEHVGGA